jgi:plastocyanin
MTTITGNFIRIFGVTATELKVVKNYFLITKGVFMDNPMHETEMDAPTIRIKDHQYLPDTITVPAGSLVYVINEDPEEHSITAKEGKFDVEIEPTRREEIIADDIGTYEYYCRYHPEMKGVLIVE